MLFQPVNYLIYFNYIFKDFELQRHLLMRHFWQLLPQPDSISQVFLPFDWINWRLTIMIIKSNEWIEAAVSSFPILLVSWRCSVEGGQPPSPQLKCRRTYGRGWWLSSVRSSRFKYPAGCFIVSCRADFCVWWPEISFDYRSSQAASEMKGVSLSHQSVGKKVADQSVSRLKHLDYPFVTNPQSTIIRDFHSSVRII